MCVYSTGVAFSKKSHIHPFDIWSPPDNAARADKKELSGSTQATPATSKDGGNSPNAPAEKEGGQTNKKRRFTKKKFALVISYCGTDFRGFAFATDLTG